MSSGRAGRAQHFKTGLTGALALAFAILPVEANSRETTIRSPVVSAAPQSPLLLLVSLKKQRVRVFDVNGEIASSRISSGMPGFDTPTGVFSLLEKNQHHVSNIYAGAPMPFMQRLTWSGIALHAGVVPGYRASHGCIRLPYSFAKSLFGTTRIGNRVVVTGEETQPIAFDHPKLFKPLPLEAPAPTVSIGASEQQVASNDKDSDLGVTRLFGVTPALARAVAEMPASDTRRPVTRSEADRMMTDKLTRLQAALKTAERARFSSTDRAKAAVRDADAARTKLEAARRVIDPLRSAVASAQKRQQDAVRTFAGYMAAMYPRDGADAVATNINAAANSEEQEADLEDAILDTTQAADMAREALARGELEFAGVQAAFAATDSARTSAIESVRQNQIDLRTAQTALVEANKETVRRLKPISVFVSLRSQKVIVRQGTEPVLEVAMAGNVPQGRVGTHVFTAMRFDPDDPDRFEWHLVSAHTPGAGEIFDPGNKKRKNRREASPQSMGANLDMASAALEAIQIPDDVLAKITELARPGASLIVSDRDLPPNENGRGTEFVVLTR